MLMSTIAHCIIKLDMRVMRTGVRIETYACMSGNVSKTRQP